MVYEKVVLKDPTLKTFLGPIHLDLYLCKSVYVRP